MVNFDPWIFSEYFKINAFMNHTDCTISDHVLSGLAANMEELKK